MTDTDSMRPALILISMLLLCAAVTDARAEIRPERLWLPAGSSHLRDLLNIAAFRALEHSDCKEVLYGRLNEYRTENADTAFTILCMKDERTTFNLVFYASDLSSGAGQTSEADDAASREELERLRNLLQGAPSATDNTASESQDPLTPPENGATPEIF